MMIPVCRLVVHRMTATSRLVARHSSQYRPRNSELGPLEEYREQLKPQNPIKRTGKILKNDMKLLGHKIRKFAGFEGEMSEDLKYQHFATHTDIVVIGSGVYAASMAFWLKKRAPYGLNVTVVADDEDKLPVNFSTGLYQQHNVPEKVMMSLFGADFLRNMDEHCSEVAPLDLGYQPNGFLFLSDDAPAAKKNSEMQKKIGARNILLPCDEIQKKIPFLNLPGVELGCLGLESEGSFNPLALQENLRRKSINLGAEFVHGKVVGFEFKLQPNIMAPNNGQAYEQLERVVMKLPNNEIHAIKFGFCIIADDQNSKNIAEFARIGKGDGLLSIPLDTDCFNRKTLCYESPELFGLSVPTVVTPNGTTFRVDGLLGQLFVSSEENEDVQQQMSKFLNFKNLKLKQTFEESYESNVLDGCGVIGPHPFYHNLLIAAGFSQHGAQHAPAVGRALMELIIDGEYKTIDLSRFGFDRLCLEEPIEGNWSLVHRQNNY